MAALSRLSPSPVGLAAFAALSPRMALLQSLSHAPRLLCPVAFCLTCVVCLALPDPAAVTRQAWASSFSRPCLEPDACCEEDLACDEGLGEAATSRPSPPSVSASSSLLPAFGLGLASVVGPLR